MTLTKAELCEILHENVGINKRESKEMIDAFFEIIASSLESGDYVKLSGFGNFDLINKTERPGRNPKTGEQISISARRVVTYQSSQELKNKVTANNYIQLSDSLLF